MSYVRTEAEGKDILVFLEPEDSKPQDSSSTNSQAGSKDQSEAFNEETGEINWDCPCLGNMVKPPCGDTFKEAFSCFVHSKEEPKGSDCVDQFRKMQACFQEHPDIYGDDLDAEESDGVEVEAEAEEKEPSSSSSDTKSLEAKVAHSD